MYELPNLNRVAAVQSPRISGKGTAVNSIVRSFGWNSRGDKTPFELFLGGVRRWTKSLIAVCRPLMEKSGV